MPGIEIEGLIRRYDNTIRYRQQLIGYNFAEEVNSVLQTCVKNQETVEAQLQEKTKECEYLKECLKIAYDKVVKLYTQFEDRTNYYQGLLKNNPAKEFLDFAIFLKTRNEFNEKANVTLNSEGDNEELLKDHLAEELIGDNIRHEFETLKLQFEDETEECKQLKIRLDDANEHISTLNSDLEAAHDLLNSEKLQRSRVESERDDLERLLLKYQQPVQPVHETKETHNRTPSHHSVINECNLIEINSGIDFDHGMPISPPSDFRDDNVSVENIDPQEFFSEEQEYHADTNTLEKTSNLSVWRKLRERVPRQSSNYFSNESTSLPTTAENQSPMQSDGPDIDIVQNLHSVQESYDVNFPVDNFKSIGVKHRNAVDVAANSVIDSAAHKFPEPLKANDNLASPKNSHKRMRKLILQTDELPNSITPFQSHFTCNISGKSFLKENSLIFHKNLHMNSDQSFKCEKCDKSFVVKRRGQKLLNCPNCDVRYNTRSLKNKMKLISGSLETKKNGEFTDVDNIHRERENINSNNGIQKPTSPPDELANSTILVTSYQSHFECDTCGRVFLKKRSIILHVREHMKKILLFRCEKCGKSLPKKNNKETIEKCPTCDVHDNDHGDEDKNKLPIVAFEGKRNGLCCDICGRQYSCKSSLGAHIRKVHGGEKPYECIECGKRFAWKKDIKRHTLVHGSQKPFKCSFCNAGFKDPSSKSKHERIVHKGDAHLQCAHCDKRFSEKNCLISHIHTQHFSKFPKQFKCTICDKSFALKHCLQRHKLSHTSQRSLKCSVCDRYFKYPTDKTRHEKKAHGKGAHFRCKHCDKSYTHKAHLIRHLRNKHV